MGTLVSALGVYLSVMLDLPTGATIVCTFGGVLALMFLFHLLLYRHRREAGAGLSDTEAAVEAPGGTRKLGVG
jgi:hypothetical protein